MKPDGTDANLVVPFLWIGSRPAQGVIERWDDLDTFVLCETREQYAPVFLPGRVCFFLQIGLEDQEPTSAEVARAESAATLVAENVRSSSTSLITCFGGRNRSGFVTALALIRLGHSPPDAIAKVRKSREGSHMINTFGPALSNDFFAKYLLGEWRP